jgi:hypothetical protein
MDRDQLVELLYQALETERGGQLVYETAVRCAVNGELRDEWKRYLDQTQRHEQILIDLMGTFRLDPEAPTPGRDVVRHLGESLVKAMEMARDAGDSDAAEIVACECVVLAETKDHQNWELLGEVAAKLDGEEGRALRAAYAEVEDQEDEHLYHTSGWCRELWIQSLGMKPVLPPPEEQQDVKTAGGAARVKHHRAEML